MLSHLSSFLLALLCATGLISTLLADEIKTFNAVSPDGLNEVRLGISKTKGLQYSVLRRGKCVIEPTFFALKIEERGWLNGKSAAQGRAALPTMTSRKIKEKLATPIYKKSSVDLAANETRVDFGDWAVVLHARNDGVAWRFETEMEGEITVRGEDTSVRFPKGTELCYTMARGLMSGWEKPAVIGPVESVSPGHPQIVMTPFTATVQGAGVVTVTESNLLYNQGGRQNQSPPRTRRRICRTVC